MPALTIGLLGDVMLGRAVGEALDRMAPEEVWADEVREVAIPGPIPLDVNTPEDYQAVVSALGSAPAAA